MKLFSLTMSLMFAFASSSAFATECVEESVKAALVSSIQQWNIDGAAIGTSLKVTGVKLKPGSEGKQGVFRNVVSLEIFEAGRGSTLQTSVEVDVQNLFGTCQALTIQ